MNYHAEYLVDTFGYSNPSTTHHVIVDSTYFASSASAHERGLIIMHELLHADGYGEAVAYAAEPCLTTTPKPPEDDDDEEDTCTMSGECDNPGGNNPDYTKGGTHWVEVQSKTSSTTWGSRVVWDVQYIQISKTGGGTIGPLNVLCVDGEPSATWPSCPVDDAPEEM